MTKSAKTAEIDVMQKSLRIDLEARPHEMFFECELAYSLHAIASPWVWWEQASQIMKPALITDRGYQYAE